MKRVVTLANLLHLWLLCVVANSYVAVEAQPLLLIAIVPAFLLFHLLVGMWEPATADRRMKLCYHGTVMLFLYAASMIPAILYHIVLGAVTYADKPEMFWASLLACLVAELTVFLNGILCVCLSSCTLSRRQRVLGIALGWLPVVNFWALRSLIHTVMDEVRAQESLEAVQEK